ncbi:AraC family transcriptional regulator [Sulfurivermis fontis]|uniref:AraC family transcriptional regulator n=1 Tax=Sulfurivermis fontis TaxID=1972068 RepID=UPI000FD6BDC5|nr:AraC family transcriptional regulator [Sulfurivermis fontis]
MKVDTDCSLEFLCLRVDCAVDPGLSEASSLRDNRRMSSRSAVYPQPLDAPFRIVDDRGRPMNPGLAAPPVCDLRLQAGALGGAVACLSLALPRAHWLEGDCWLAGGPEADPVNIVLSLSGVCDYRQTRGDGIHFNRGELKIFLGTPEQTQARVCNGEESFFAVDISIGRRGLERLYEEGALPPPLASLAAAGVVAPRESTWPLLPVYEHIARELAASLAWGPEGRLYREGKTLELIALLLHEWNAPRTAPGPSLVPLVRSRLDGARDRLLAQMADPPSIEALAREAGLGLTAFREAFRRRFGLPVYEFLRVARLEAARTLLADGLPVQLAAHRVGYASEAAFSRAYRRHFGHPPSAVR